MLNSTLLSMPVFLLACDSSSACGMFLCGSKRRLWRTSSRRDFSSRACGCSAHLSTDFDTFCCQLLDVGENGSISSSRTSSRKYVGKVRCVDVALKGKRINHAANNFFPESDRKMRWYELPPFWYKIGSPTQSSISSRKFESNALSPALLRQSCCWTVVVLYAAVAVFCSLFQFSLMAAWLRFFLAAVGVISGDWQL